MQTFSYLKEKKGAGFYVSAIGAVISLAVAILYAVVFNASAYMNWLAFVLPIIACVAFFALSAFKVTAPFSALIMGLLNFVAFLIFIHASYLIYSEIFFGGFNWSTILETRSLCYFICTLLYIASIVLSNIGIYLKHDANC